MRLTRRDWPHLRGTAFFAVAVLAPALIVMGLAHEFMARMDRKQAALQERAALARAQLARLEEERRNLDEYREEYQRLLARRVIGEEHRLDWIEAIDRIRDQRPIFSARYAISPQRPYQPEVPLPGEPLTLLASDMRLELTLLHEGELARFFEALRQEAKGMFLLQGCRISRLGPADDMRFAPHLEADCQLTWITLNDRRPQ